VSFTDGAPVRDARICLALMGSGRIAPTTRPPKTVERLLSRPACGFCRALPLRLAVAAFSHRWQVCVHDRLMLFPSIDDGHHADKARPAPRVGAEHTPHDRARLPHSAPSPGPSVFLARSSDCHEGSPLAIQTAYPRPRTRDRPFRRKPAPESSRRLSDEGWAETSRVSLSRYEESFLNKYDASSREEKKSKR